MFSSDSLAIFAIVIAGVEILGIAVALRAIMTARTSQGAAAWAIGLVAFPLIALPLYSIFGGRRFRGYVAARRHGDADIQRLASEIADMLERDFAHCDEIEELDEGQLPLHTRIGAHTARLFAPVL